MKKLLTITAAIEFGTGLVLLAFPSLLTTILFNAQLDSPVGLLVARVGGVALAALGTDCWLARFDEVSRAARGLVGAMIVYNGGVVLVLMYAALVIGLSGIGLWPVVMVHTVMTGWCGAKLLRLP